MANRPTPQQLNAKDLELPMPDISSVPTNDHGGFAPWASPPFYWSPGMAQTVPPQHYGLLGYLLVPPGYRQAPMNTGQPWPAAPIPPLPFTHADSMPQTSDGYFFAPPPQSPTVVNSTHSATSEGEERQDRAAQDDATAQRREKRRAQNRVAQRAFRARKEEMIRESSVSVEALRDKLTQLQSANGDLSMTVSNLRSQIEVLERQISQMQSRRMSDYNWDNFDLDMDDAPASSETGARPPLGKEASHDSNDSGVFDMSNGAAESLTVTAGSAENPSAGSEYRTSDC